ncbi:GNAT family N-acetyltransferase [Patescibacteria group bacterium]|nr:GNAT family N-acetyltransferase [Patescibacteria group bacterium]
MNNELTFRPAEMKDFEKLTQFGVPLIKEEYSLVVEKGYGQFYFAQLGEKVVGLIEVMYKCFDDKVEENILQPKLRQLKELGKSYTHDDIKFIEGEQMYISWIAVLPEYQNQHIGSRICRYIIKKIPSELEKTSVVRINNLPSIRLLMREFGMSIIGIKPINQKIIGSRETNFITSSLVPPILDPSLIKTRRIFYKGSEISMEKEFLVPVSNGEEEDLEGIPEFKETLKEIFELKFKIRGLFKAEELKIKGDKSYFYC